MKKMKKILCTVLAGVMALSLCTTAFAAGNSITDLTEGAELELTSITKGATIEVVVPTSLSIGLNPYEMNVKLENGTLTDDTTKGAQIISPVYKIENKSSLAIDVDVSVTGALNGEGMSFVAAKPATGDTTKSAFVQMVYGLAAPGTDTMPSSTKKVTLKADEAVAGDKVTMLKHDAANASNTSNLLFNFSGNLNSKSATAWTDDDTIGATIVFTFAVNPGK